MKRVIAAASLATLAGCATPQIREETVPKIREITTEPTVLSERDVLMYDAFIVLSRSLFGVSEEDAHFVSAFLHNAVGYTVEFSVSKRTYNLSEYNNIQCSLTISDSTGQSTYVRVTDYAHNGYVVDRNDRTIDTIVINDGLLLFNNITEQRLVDSLSTYLWNGGPAIAKYINSTFSSTQNSPTVDKSVGDLPVVNE